jgi:uncharacterized protein with GYD domain
MPLYLGRFKYSSEALKALMENPQDRKQAAAQTAESLGARLIDLWYCFGEYDGAYLLEAPDNATVVALAMLVGASGQVSSETTVLIPMDEAQDAMRKAAAASFRAPSG